MIVVCGEALMDVFDAGTTITGVRLDARVGGSPLNVAIGLARLEQPVAFFGALGSGFLGDRLLAALRDEGVSVDAVERNRARTTLGLVGLDGAGVPDYAFYGEGAADRQLPLQALQRVPRAAAFVFGSFAMVVEPVASTLRALVEREHARAVIAYDPNVRLNVEPDLQRWHEVLQWMLPRTHVLKVSEEDLQHLFPHDDPRALALRWVQAGVPLVVLTSGAVGCWACTRNLQVAVASPAVQVVDTVGAGDTFQAATLTALAERACLTRDAIAGLDEAPLREVLDFAVRAAAITCSRRGADLPRRRELI